ncbi:MAG: hypothetical protein IAE80_05680 [Anaerolinea sp.]|nr:hypothetical protein [Anaerolinea sp.]
MENRSRAAVAEEQSRENKAQIGEGSFLFLFSHKWNIKPNHGVVAKTNLLDGVTLHNFDDELLYEFEACNQAQKDTDAWYACNIELNPGVYKLRLKLPSSSFLEQTVVLCRDWQTSVFCGSKEFADDVHTLVPDLPNAAIFLHRRNHLNLNDEQTRFTEEARLSLCYQRQVSNAGFRDILERFAESPMLTIYGIHLLLLNNYNNKNYPKTLIERLRTLLGYHPDVEALALKLGQESEIATFESPTMLRQSWKYLVLETIRARELITRYSVLSVIAEYLLASNLWLTWGGTSHKFQASRSDNRSQTSLVANTLKVMLEHNQPYAQTGQIEALEGISPMVDDIEPKQSEMNQEALIRRFVRELLLPRSTGERLLEKSNQ